MNLVFCMAGRYQRFRDAGYQQPKFLLPWRGEALLTHILEALVDHTICRHVLLVAHERDRPHAAAIEAILARVGLDADHLAFIGSTAGQADTALVALDELDRRWQPRDRRVVFHNIDTLLCDRSWPMIADTLATHDGWIDTFPADRDCYSYVAVDETGLVTDMREKEVISPMATSGMYGFADIDRFRDLHANCLTDFGGERYISTIYRQLLAEGGRIAVGHQATADRTLIFGTPAEYEAWVASG